MVSKTERCEEVYQETAEVLKDLSCLVCVTKFPLFLLHLSELLSSSSSSSDELRPVQAKEWVNDHSGI